MGKKGINRRQFIGKTAAGVFSAGLGFPLLKGKSLTQNSTEEIPTRILGRTKLEIPILSFGVMNSDSPDLIRKAIEMGIKHLDTASVYLRGNSEMSIGKTLDEDKLRNKVYLATKMRFARDNNKKIFLDSGPAREPLATKENFQKQLETSLQRLRTDYVDILYLHSCDSPEMVTFEPMIEALVQAKKEGKTRFIGTSSHSNDPNVLQATVDAGVYDVILTAQSVTIDRKEEIKEAIAYAASKDIGVVAMKTHGGVRRNKEADSGIDHESAYKWVLSDSNICTTIPGMTTFEQLDFNLNVIKNFTLTAREETAVRQASFIQDPLHCQNCRTCVESCLKGVEIPSLMRAYMYAEGYGNLLQAEMTTEILPENKGLKTCAECSICTASCKYGIKIYDRLQSLFAQGLTQT